MRAFRYLMIAVLIEATAIAILAGLVAILGPPEPAAAVDYAAELGICVGPIAGFLLCVGGGWFVARHLDSGHVAAGAMLGATVAAIDVALLMAGGAEFQAIFLVSNLGRVLAGALGGWMAGQGD